MTRPATVQQPGPAIEPRIIAVPCQGHAFTFEIAAGERLLAAVHHGFNAAGFTGGVVELPPLALGPFAYVMPALSTDGANAAFYSETFRPSGMSRLERGAMTVGTRAGAPFFHCHAIWREANGRRSGGHILPDETIVAENVMMRAFGLEGAAFDATPDPETNFTLFAPTVMSSLGLFLGPIAPLAPARAMAVKVPEQVLAKHAEHDVTGHAGDAPRDDRRRRVGHTTALAMRLKPNQDLHAAIETACFTHGIRRARLRGGVGSLIGAAFEDGTIVENFATEVFLAGGEIAPDALAHPRVRWIDAGLVDYTGALASGRLARNRNPVLMTFELVLEILEG